jgi:hypothetical protein
MSHLIHEEGDISNAPMVPYGVVRATKLSLVQGDTMQHIIEWNGNKYVWSSLSAAWYGHYGIRGGDYPGDNKMVPLSNWGHLFDTAAKQGIVINRTPKRTEIEDDYEPEIKVRKAAKSEKKIKKSISIFGGE